ncbi:MAG: phage holin family protein [Planctomycetota bacterium]|jgi:hypothetical protein
MSDPDPELLGGLKDELGRLAGDVGRMVRLRWQLARLEGEAALSSVKRLVVAWIAAAAFGLSGLVMALVALACLWPETSQPYVLWALLAVGLVLVVAAGLTAWLSRRRFRSTFVGLEETLEELREDLVWLAEWSQREAAEEGR